MRSLLAFLAAFLLNFGSPTRPSPILFEVSTETVRLVIQVGLGPEALAAAGVTAQESADLLARVEQDPSIRAAFIAATEERGSAHTAAAAAIEAARADPGNESLRRVAVAAAASTAAAQQAVTQAASGVVAVAVAGLPEVAATRLATYRQTRIYRVPAAMWAASQAADEWEGLELALIAERRAQRLNVTVPESAAQLLAQCRAQAQVVQAQQNIDASIVAIQAVFAAR